MFHRSRVLTGTAVLALAGVAALAGCSKSEDSNKPSAGSSAGQQVVASSSPQGAGCTLQQYGATQLNLKDAIVGFSQSEKEANPFRIAETQSIKDEAAKIGVKKLLTTNANSQLDKQISATMSTWAPWLSMS